MADEHWICPGCGAELRVGVRGCPPCSKPRRRKPKPKVPRRPWEQHSSHDGLDLPDDDFDYDEFVSKEFGRAPHRTVPIQWYWWLTAIVLLALMVFGVRLLFF